MKLILQTLRPKIDGGGEVKSFADGGKSLINLALFESNNYDLAKIDLTNGSISRLTKHFSYDEGTYPSPDGKWVIFRHIDIPHEWMPLA